MPPLPFSSVSIACKISCTSLVLFLRVNPLRDKILFSWRMPNLIPCWSRRKASISQCCSPKWKYCSIKLSRCARYTIQPPYDKLRKEYGLLEHCQEITHACECAHLAKGCTLA
ncbi:uncharacterized protein LOC141879282 isoform X2 [Acropora palmata]|uniref:uncharacterized protein LOC141879282 isoform X2 n=1 Tax=Acropora palmata TaxID=6131 RepID=UPI003DA170E5